MKIYTKNGDRGKTSLIGGRKVSKHDLQVEAYGSIDELNSFMGLLKDYSKNDEINQVLFKVQLKLFTIGSILAQENTSTNSAILEKLNISAKDTNFIELQIDKLEKKLHKLSKFIITGGHKLVSYCHVSRSICRRAERKITKLSDSVKLDSNILPYINRLSDFLFVLSRYFSNELDIKETYW